MIAWMMIRGGLPVIPGVIAMMAAAFLGGLFLSEHLEGPKQSYNLLIQKGHYFAEGVAASMFSYDALYEKVVIYNYDTGEAIKEYESATKFLEENDGVTADWYASGLGKSLMAVRDFLILPRGTTASVVGFMVIYMVTEFILFFLMLMAIKKRGERTPEIKQLFEVEQKH